MESTSYVLSFQIMVFFYLVTTGWIFAISLDCVRVQSINHDTVDAMLLPSGNPIKRQEVLSHAAYDPT